jgi:hypothetical protein
MAFDFATLQPSGRDSDFSVSVYTPVDASTAGKFTALLKTTPDNRKAVPGVVAENAGAKAAP